MAARRLVPALVSSFLSLCLLSSAALAGPAVKVVTQTRIATPYKLVLKIGPAEMMNMGGEMMRGGAKASCQMGMLSLQADAAAPAPARMCNHHVELHVYNLKSGKVITHANVHISMRNVGMRMTITVPIAMMSSGMDYHFGNNVYAPPGAYIVLASVNRKAATFNLTLK